jgi:hypothetical protein
MGEEKRNKFYSIKNLIPEANIDRRKLSDRLFKNGGRFDSTYRKFEKNKQIISIYSVSEKKIIFSSSYRISKDFT